MLKVGMLGLALATGALILRFLAAYPIYAFPGRPSYWAWFFVGPSSLGLFVATAGMVLLGILSVARGILPPWCAIALMVASPFVGVFFTITVSAAAGGSALGRASRRWAACLVRWLATTSSERRDRGASDPQGCARGRTSENSVPANFGKSPSTLRFDAFHLSNAAAHGILDCT